MHMVCVIMRALVRAHVDGLVVQRQVVGKRVVIVLMLAARVILVDEDLEAIVVPVLYERVAVRVDEDVVDKFAEDIEFLGGPDDFETTLEIFFGILGPEPAIPDVLPARLLPGRCG